MTTELAIVGDVHGNVSALRGLLAALDDRGGPHTVFLGDYINKGPDSAGVLELLVARSHAGRATLLRGNHESSMLDALDTGVLTPFLKMGGAMTIRSYVGEQVGPDVLAEFRAGVPSDHLNAIRRMPLSYESQTLVAQHGPPTPSTRRFQISAHVPVGTLPQIGHQSAQIDTGCGDGPGRLTALLWPSLGYVQVSASGHVVAS